jgi:lycopene beta-cyclase
MLDERWDCVIAGGGLAGGLVALALAARRPSLRVVLVEASHGLGQNHTWSFHDTDLSDGDRAWVDPVVARRWPGYAVQFPTGAREMEGGYASITGAHFDAVVRARCRDAGHELLFGETIVAIGPNVVRTAGGRTLRAPLVLDARGLAAGHALRGPCGYQKFLGQEVELAEDAPAGLLRRPMLMDAGVEQTDGFRFVYVLPFGRRQLLVEDTYYSTQAALDPEPLRQRLSDYCRARGLRIARVLREEAGVLPLPFEVQGEAPSGSPFVIGYRGGWFHPLTGYSLPVAVRVAAAIAAEPEVAAVTAALRSLWDDHVHQARFCGWLARVMFQALPPDNRWELLARFYRLPPDTIARFYALRMTLGDRVRLIAGRPPRAFSLWSALLSTRSQEVS